MNVQETLNSFSNYWGGTNDPSEYVQKYIVNRTTTAAKKYLKSRYNGDIPNIDTILDDFQNIFLKNDENIISLSDFYLLDTITQLIKDPTIVIRTLVKAKDDKKFWDKNTKRRYIYTSNKRENFNLASNEIYQSILSNEFVKDIQNISREEEAVFKALISDSLKKAYKEIKASLTDRYVKAITYSVNVLNNLGVLESQVDKNNIERKRMDLDILSFPLKQKNGDFKYGVTDLMDESFVSKLPFEKLVLLHSFYYNRLKKVAENLGIGIFILYKSGELFQSTEKEEDTNEAWKHYKQYATISKIISEGMEKVQLMLAQQTKEEIEQSEDYQFLGTKQFKISTDKLYDDYLARYENAYSIYSNGEETLREDSSIIARLRVIDYWQKDLSMETSLLMAMEHMTTDNWGYIPEIENGKNSIERRAENILLGFDVEGFNMPVRLHFPYKKIMQFFRNRDSSFEIPNYVGNDDIGVDNQNISAPILMPLSPTHRKRFITSVKSMDPNSYYYKFAKHIECMQYKNNLTRLLKWKDPLDRRGLKTYTNLKTGKEVSYARENP